MLSERRCCVMDAARRVGQMDPGSDQRCGPGAQMVYFRERAARLDVRLHDVPWEALYAPSAKLVNFAADRLNKLQFLTIRGYLTLVFSALVVLLMVLAIWQ